MQSFEVVPRLETSRRVLSNRNAKIKLTRDFEVCQENGQLVCWPVSETCVIKTNLLILDTKVVIKTKGAHTHEIDLRY
jgi:hypothetical protein